MANKQPVKSPSSNQRIAANNDNDDQEGPSKDNDEYPIVDSCMVEVLPRTWPGSNKIGGIARVTKCHFIPQKGSLQQTDDPNYNGDGKGGNANANANANGRPSHIDVRYVVMGGREKMVPMEYCRPAPQYDHNINRRRTGGKSASDGNTILQTNDETKQSYILQGSMSKMARLNLRDRSSLLGRCKLCGSLRSDCRSCDWVEDERKRREQEDKMARSENDPNSNSTKKSKVDRRTRIKRKEIKSILLLDDSDSSDDEDGSGSGDHDASYSSSSDESFIFRGRPKLMSTRQRKALSSSDDDDDDGSSTDDEILAKLKVLPARTRKADSKMKRKKFKARFRASNRIFKARMDFLNECLNSGKKPAARKKDESSDARRVRLHVNDASVLENIGSSGCASEAGSFKRSRIEIQGIVEEGRKMHRNEDSSIDVMQGGGYRSKRQKRKVPIPSFKAVDVSMGSDADDDAEFYQSHGTIEISNAPALGSVALDREVSNESNPSVAYAALNESVGTVERRVGFVDGDDIGEKEIDEEEEKEVLDRALDGSSTLLPDLLAIQQSSNRHEEISGYYEDNPELNTFIQPEGDEFAENLPSDLIDSSIQLPFASLPNFFAEIQVNLSEVQIPKFEAATLRLEKEMEGAQNQIDRNLCKKEMLDIERRW